MNRDLFGISKGRGPYALYAKKSTSGSAITFSGWVFETVKSNFQVAASGANGSAFPVPAAGFYRVLWQPNIQTSQAMYCAAVIYVNDVAVATGYNLAFNANPIGMTAIYMGELKANDKIAANVTISSGSATYIESYLTIEQIPASA